MTRHYDQYHARYEALHGPNVRFKWIKGYEGLYQVTDQGDVWSFYCRKGKPVKLKPLPGHHDYPVVQLYKHKASKRFYIHSLVAKHFVPGWKPGLEVNHKNLIRQDCRASNLEWLTHAANVEHAKNNFATGSKPRPVIGVHKETGKEVKFKSIQEAAKGIGGYSSQICFSCRNKGRSHKGYRWSYA